MTSHSWSSAAAQPGESESPLENRPEPLELRVLRPDDLRAKPQQTSTSDLRTPAAKPESSDAGWHGLEPTESLLAELKESSQQLEAAHPEEILGWAIERFGDNFTMATAFGPEGMAILYWLAKLGGTVPVFNLETGYQFQETLDLRDKVAQRYGIEVELKRPELSVQDYEKKHGGPLYVSAPDQCCFDRKIKVLRGALAGKHAWASAIRRDQSPDRAEHPIVGWDEKFKLVKVSPLANWTKAQVWKLITDHDIPYNPLHDQGYPSIGCAPCTRAIMLGEDERAGRWSGSAKTECGLHSR